MIHLSHRAKLIHISHTPPTPFISCTTLIPSTSAAFDIIPEPPTYSCPAFIPTNPPSSTPSLPSPSHPQTLSTCTHPRQTTVHASHASQPPHPHRVPRQSHKQNKDDHMTTHTTKAHRPSSKSEINLIILQVNIHGIKNKLEEIKLFIHNTHADILTIQKTKHIPKAQTPKVHNFTTFRTDRLHKARGVLLLCCCLIIIIFI